MSFALTLLWVLGIRATIFTDKLKPQSSNLKPATLKPQKSFEFRLHLPFLEIVFSSNKVSSCRIVKYTLSFFTSSQGRCSYDINYTWTIINLSSRWSKAEFAKTSKIQFESFCFPITFIANVYEAIGRPCCPSFFSRQAVCDEIST